VGQASLTDRRRRISAPALIGGVVVLLILAAASVLVGAQVLTPAQLFSDSGSLVLEASRIPRTLALVLAGSSLAVAGQLMQMMSRNKFVEPSTAGTTESVALGLLLVTIVAPGAAQGTKMLVGTAFALAGTGLFLAVLRRIPLRDPVMVPLVGLMLGGVIASVSTFVAYRTDLSQSLQAWQTADLSGLVRGRWELLWIVALVLAVTWIAADRFTVAGLGEEFTTNLGLNHRRVVALGLVLVSVTASVVVVVVGSIPFLGLVVPNLVAMTVGDNVRRAVPWNALLGAVMVLACDTLGRLVVHPYEIPLGTIMGVLGAVLFLWLILRRTR
jgi:iron complex transport system permease protein